MVDTDQGPADEMVETAGAEGQGKKKKRNKKKKATATTEPTDAAESEGADAAGVEEDTTSPADETPLGAAAPVQAEPVAAAEGGKEVAVPPAKEPTPEQAPGSAPATKAALPPSPAPAAAAPPAVPAPAPPAAEPKPVKVAPAIKLAAPVMAAVVQGTDKTATPASADGKSELVSKMALLSKSVVGDSVKAWGGAGAGSAGIPAASVTVPPGTRTFPYEELKSKLQAVTCRASCLCCMSQEGRNSLQHLMPLHALQPCALTAAST